MGERSGRRRICRTAWWLRKVSWSNSLWSLLSPSPAAPASRFLPSKEVKEPHCKDTQDPISWIIWCLLRHHITCHLPPCPVSQNSAITVARTSQKKSCPSKHMLMVHEASCPSKILLVRYLAKLMACRRISFAICYITLKMRISLDEPLKWGAHLLALGTGGVEGRFVR